MPQSEPRAPFARSFVPTVITRAVLLLLFLPLPVSAGDPPLRQTGWRIVLPQRPMPLFHQGDGLGLDRRSDVYVWDSLEARVRKFAPSGRLLALWHVPRTSPGAPWAPNHLAVDPEGNASVLADGVSRYSSSGALLARWRVASNPLAVAARSAGNLFVLSAEGTIEPNTTNPAGGNARIDKYSPAGMLLATWRTPVIAARDIQPDGLAVDSHGNVYVTVGIDNSCYKACMPVTSFLYRFNPAGRITFTYSPGGKPFGPVSAVDRQGNLYLLPHDAAFDSMSILEVGPNCRKLAGWPGFGGILKQLLLLQVDSTGRMVVASSAIQGLEPWQRSAVVRVLSPTGRQVAQFGKILVQRVYDMGLGLAINRAGNRLYLTGGPQSYVYRVMTVAGTILHQVDNPEGKPPIVWNPRAIAVDGAANVYVNDSMGGRVVKFSPSGKHVATFPLPAGYRGGADGLSLDSYGNIYVVSNSHVLKLSPTGALLASFGGPGTGQGKFAGPGDVVVDGQGNIYVADTYNDRIQKLSPSGQLIVSWGTRATFDRPIRLAIDPATGHIWVADLTHAYLQEFTSGGAFLGRRAEYGVFPGQLDQADSLSLDGSGNLYVLDYGNNRVQERFKG